MESMMAHLVRRAVQFFLAIFIAVFSINLTGAMQAHATTTGDRETQLFARDIDVTPTAPTKNDVCGLANDNYTIQSQTGVTYKVGFQTKAAGTHSTGELGSWARCRFPRGSHPHGSSIHVRSLLTLRN